MIFKDKNLFKLANFVSVDTIDLSSYLSDEKTKYNWYGVSFQTKDTSEKFEYRKFIIAFSNIIDKFIEIDEWFIQPLHTDKLFPWFLKEDRYSEIENLQKLVAHPLKFKGFISVDSAQIKFLFRDLFYYSYLTRSQDLMIFNKVKPFVIELGQHLSIDIMSTDDNIIKMMIFILEKSNFLIKKYK